MCLDSLLDQKTNRDYFVVFNIPYLYVMDDNAKYIVPNELLIYGEEHPKLLINRDINDYGPIIKTYGAFKYATNPDDIIIALDDDIVYHEDILEWHMKGTEKYPNYVLCVSGDIGGRKVDLDPEGNTFRIVHDIINFPIEQDTFMISPGHATTVCYKRKFFEEDFNPELFAMADGDDPLMGYYHKLHNRPIIAISHKKEYADPDCKTADCDKFPFIGTVAYPEYAGGWLIRQKYTSVIGVHGRAHPSVRDLLFDGNYIYIIKDKLFINLYIFLFIPYIYV